MKVTAAVLAAIAGTASAKTISVATGQNGFTFQPDDIKADVGDLIEFTFFPVNHSVAQGTLSQPCQPVAQGGFFSGYQPVTTGTAPQLFRIRVNDTNPIYFYCTQPTRTHCQAGMVGVVNARANGTVADLKKNAAAASSAPIAPPSIFGGQLAPASNSSSGGGSSSNGTTSRPASSGATPAPTGTGGAASSGTGAPATSTSRAAAPTGMVAVGGLLGALAIAAVGLV